MDTAEARGILADFVKRYRSRSFGELRTLIESPEYFEVAGASGASYQVEIDACWDDPRKPGEMLHVLFAIDDGGWRAFVPLVDSILIRADGAPAGGPA